MTHEEHIAFRATTLISQHRCTCGFHSWVLDWRFKVPFTVSRLKLCKYIIYHLICINMTIVAFACEGAFRRDEMQRP